MPLQDNELGDRPSGWPGLELSDGKTFSRARQLNDSYRGGVREGVPMGRPCISGKSQSGGFLWSILAYIDPGSGTILLQLIIGSLIGAGLFFREGVGRLLRVFRRS